MSRPKLRTDRLLLVADKLRTLSERQFDMRHIAESAAPRFTCGTTACVAGWAGLTYEDALARFFGMTLREVANLFYDGFRSTAKEKAAEIEALCRAYEERRACS